MKKYLFFLNILFSIIFLIKCYENEMNNDIEDNSEEGYDEDFDENGFFRASLRQYLMEKNLINSDKLIEKEEMRTIFLITEGTPERVPSHLKKIFKKLAEHFVDVYYNDKKQIRGKDIYNLMDINEISMKFDEIAGSTPLYDDYDEEEDDPNNTDSIGESKTEL